MHNLIFVYGTLRRGEANAALLRDASCLGRHVTAPCYTLYELGGYPGAVAGGSGMLVGEVYRVTSGQLSRLDRLEEYPRLYKRRLIPTPWGAAWIYLYRRVPDRRRIVQGGDWQGVDPKIRRLTQIYFNRINVVQQESRSPIWSFATQKQVSVLICENRRHLRINKGF